MINNKVLFAHDGPLYLNEEGQYFGAHFTDNHRKRFLQLGNEVTFLMRVNNLNKEKNQSRLHLISSSQAFFKKVPNFKSVKKYIKYKSLAENIIAKEVENHDVLVARLPSAIGGLAIKYAIKYKKPYMIEMVGCVFDAYWNYNWKGKLIAHYKLKEYKRILHEAPYVVYVTSQFLQNRYPTKGKSIPCSNVELIEVDQKDIQTRLNKLKSFSKKQTIDICTIAGIDVPYKGQDDVIKALTKLREKNIFINYHIIGKGDSKYLQDIAEKNKISNQVFIHGALPHNEVFDFLRGMDLYIQPSKQEGLPRSLIEAMSVALPSFGARTAGIPELINEDCIFEPGDVNQIVSILAEINLIDLKKFACENFEESKKYQSDILQIRRLNFYKLFLKENNLD
jgi:glycosyltransferase involved in cell wall biosynthesis